MVNLVKSDFFPFVAWGLRLTGNNNLPYLFNAIPDVSKENNSYKTMSDIKRGFGLTNEEVKFIEDNFHVYEYENKDIFENCGKNNKKDVSSNIRKTMSSTKKRPNKSTKNRKNRKQK